MKARLSPRELIESRRRTHYVYRCFTSSGLLLYVGCSSDPVRRMREHKGRSVWFCEVADVTIDEHPNFWGARVAEDAAIRDERPVFNRNGGKRRVTEWAGGATP